MSETDENATYDVLDIPTEARERNWVEILRAGMVSEQLFVAARPAFEDPGMWGEVLAEITRRVARGYASAGKYTYKDALVAIESAFAADLGGPVARKTSRKVRRTNARAKPRAKTRAKAPVRKTARRKAR